MNFEFHNIGLIDNFKRRLKKALPEVKNSHRLQALGRGLGYKTYESLLHAAQKAYDEDRPLRVTVHDDLFNTYFDNSDIVLPTQTVLSDMVREWMGAGQ